MYHHSELLQSASIKGRHYSTGEISRLSPRSSCSNFFKRKVKRVPSNLLHFGLEVDVFLLVEETPLLVYLVLVGDVLLGRAALNLRLLNSGRVTVGTDQERYI